MLFTDVNWSFCEMLSGDDAFTGNELRCTSSYPLKCFLSYVFGET